MKRRRRRIRKLRLLLLIVVLGVLGTTALGLGLVSAIASQIPALDPSAHHQQVNGYIYAGDGHTILSVLRGSEARVIVPSNQISPQMKQAIVAIEDKRFYEHRGIDVHGMARALWADVPERGLVQGGSTITQQFVKNTYVANERSIARKLKEAALAWQLEQRWSKDRILTAYLNTIYFGNGAYGIQQAALTYFGKRAADLTLPEAALLAGIPEDPSLYDPVVNPQHAKARRNLVLRQMLDQHDISPPDYRRAKRAPLPKPEDVHLPGTQGPCAVLRELREATADRPLRRGQGVRRRPEGEDDDRSPSAEARPRRDRPDADEPGRPDRGARGDRPTHGRRAHDDRRLQLPQEPVQPRRTGRATAGLVVQALRPRDRAVAAGSRRRRRSPRSRR